MTGWWNSSAMTTWRRRTWPLPRSLRSPKVQTGATRLPCRRCLRPTWRRNAVRDLGLAAQARSPRLCGRQLISSLPLPDVQRRGLCNHQPPLAGTRKNPAVSSYATREQLPDPRAVPPRQLQRWQAGHRFRPCLPKFMPERHFSLPACEPWHPPFLQDLIPTHVHQRTLRFSRQDLRRCKCSEYERHK